MSNLLLWMFFQNQCQSVPRRCTTSNKLATINFKRGKPIFKSKKTVFMDFWRFLLVETMKLVYQYQYSALTDFLGISKVMKKRLSWCKNQFPSLEKDFSMLFKVVQRLEMIQLFSKTFIGAGWALNRSRFGLGAGSYGISWSECDQKIAPIEKIYWL